MTDPDTPRHRDRLRELLDAVLDEDNHRLGDMAASSHASPFHFSRQLTRDAGEPPVAMRRRVMLERAAWQLQQGMRVTDAALAAGYDSVDGFSRAFTRAHGHTPSTAVSAGSTDHWLDAPNGIHFHPPTALWVEDRPAPAGGEVLWLMLHHDLDDTRDLLGLADGLDDHAYRRIRLPDHAVLAWDGRDGSIAEVLRNQVHTKEVWVAAIAGHDVPAAGDSGPAALLQRHDAVAVRWLDVVRDIEDRRAWGDRLIDALCEPPESFLLASVIAHVLTFAAARRHLVRQMLDADERGVIDDGDPITWLRRRTGGAA
ncbi:AraC family transcriptional regulator [soil metagenome]